MRINIENFFKNIYIYKEGAFGEKSNQFVLTELVKHLKELRDRSKNGDTKVAEEFFNIYVFNDNQ